MVLAHQKSHQAETFARIASTSKARERYIDSNSLVVKLVEATASLLSQALVVIEEGDDASWVDAVTKGFNEVFAHMEANVCSYKVTQPAYPMPYRSATDHRSILYACRPVIRTIQSLCHASVKV